MSYKYGTTMVLLIADGAGGDPEAGEEGEWYPNEYISFSSSWEICAHGNHACHMHAWSCMQCGCIIPLLLAMIDLCLDHVHTTSVSSTSAEQDLDGLN